MTWDSFSTRDVMTWMSFLCSVISLFGVGQSVCHWLEVPGWGYYFDWEEIRKLFVCLVITCILVWINNYSTNSPVRPQYTRYNTADHRSRTCRVWVDWPIPFMALWRISASCLALKLTKGLTLPLYACRRRDAEEVSYRTVSLNVSVDLF